MISHCSNYMRLIGFMALDHVANMIEIFYPKYPKRRVYKIVAGSEHAANSWVETVNQLTQDGNHFDIL